MVAHPSSAWGSPFFLADCGRILRHTEASVELQRAILIELETMRLSQVAAADCTANSLNGRRRGWLTRILPRRHPGGGVPGGAIFIHEATMSSGYFIGLDLGQVSQFTALAIVDCPAAGAGS
jgi:hypothetical protein